MSIRNLKDGTKKPWLCECYPQGRSGKRVRKRFATKGEATAYEKFVLKEIDEKPWLGEKADHRRLSEIVDLWFYLHGKSLKSGAMTYARLCLIVEGLNNPIAAHLTAKDLAHYRAQRLNKGRGRQNTAMSNSSNNRDLGSLKSMFNKLASLNEWSLPNPVVGLETIKNAQSELSFLKEEQIFHLFEVIDRSWVKEELRLIFKICLATGARINEAVLLKSDQVYDGKITFVKTKGRRNRTLPISPDLYHDLKKGKTGRIFTCGYGVAHKWIDIALPELPKGQATHVLRHTFATQFMRNGGNILDLKAALGHVNIEQTMVYAHFSPDHLSSVVDLNPIANLKL
ncbi:tyrosine-type recombinase/integrase [uncultured Vibrio sp.]|uniref:phage integrase n=1 Tax=uncultured Vibrio sp. TaxID=114054 RepID=UPI0025D0F819|nr:tyrosine-type recombinase/integrase [uncultured Vibrio sp.]